jgi:hypothetical protein
LEVVDFDEVWRRIPPEEKLITISRSHGASTITCALVIFVSGALAVGFHNVWIFWGAVLVSPVFFQTTSQRMWRKYRSELVLQYLAARSAARRYAFKSNASDLSVQLLLRGTLTVIKKTDDQESWQEINSNKQVFPVWIALFRGAVVIMSEGDGGARVRFLHLITKRLEVTAYAKQDKENFRIVELIGSEMDQQHGKIYQLTSDTNPGALLVFEKLLLEYLRKANIVKQRSVDSAIISSEVISSEVISSEIEESDLIG